MFHKWFYQDRDRLKLHEMLESETIKASALRYKLHRMPTQVKDEIQGTIEQQKTQRHSQTNVFILKTF
jgi:hypothetical protein